MILVKILILACETSFIHTQIIQDVPLVSFFFFGNISF